MGSAVTITTDAVIATGALRVASGGGLALTLDSASGIVSLAAGNSLNVPGTLTVVGDAILPAGSIGTGELASGAVTFEKLHTAVAARLPTVVPIVADDIVSDAVTESKILAGAVTPAKLGGVGAIPIGWTIALANIPDGMFTAGAGRAKFVPGFVNDVLLATGAVTEPKIAPPFCDHR